MLDRSAKGRRTPETMNEVERGAIRRFAEALADGNPIYVDADYAKALGFAGQVAPPCFPVSFHLGGDLREQLGVPARQLVLSEVAIEYERPIVAGDRLSVSSRVVEIGERTGPAGRVEVAVLEDEGRDAAGALVYRLRRTFVVRATSTREG